MALPPWVQMAITGKIRDKPVSESFFGQLEPIIKSLGPNYGVRVLSGGQAPKGSGGRRTGSTRHDIDQTGHANTADFVLTRDGRDIRPNEDKELYSAFFKKASPIFPGLGHYEWGVHAGGGKPAAWGPDTTSRSLDPVFAQAINAGRGQVNPSNLPAGGSMTIPRGQVDSVQPGGQRAMPSHYGLFQQQQQPQGVLNGGGGIRGFLDNNRGALRGLGTELLASGLDSRNRFTGRGMMAGTLADMGRQDKRAKTKAEQAQANATIKYMEANGAPPELLDLARSPGGVATAFKLFTAGQGKGNDVYGTPIYGVDAEGKTTLGVIGKTGEYVPVDTGGTTPTQPIQWLDTGTGFVPGSKQTGRPLPGGETIPIENRAAAAETARGQIEGKTEAEAVADLPRIISNAEQTIKVIDSIMNDPALPGITGMFQGRMPPLTQAGTDLWVKIKQAQGKTFLEAYQTLKGGGQITEIEGAKAEAAVARLERAQSTPAYKEALQDLRDIIETGVQRARSKAGDAIQSPNAGNGLKPGSVEDGYRYKGGPPGDPNSWEQVQ